jgi:hypothetical protein
MKRVSLLPPLSPSLLSGKEEVRVSELSPGKRWKVVEVRKNGVYSLNPFPGAREAHLEHK